VKSTSELVVPRSIQRPAAIKSGDRLRFSVSSGAITIESAKPATYKPTKSELAATRKGEAAVARGEHVSLDDFLHGLDSNRSKARTKTNRKIFPLKTKAG
jgi:ABC-type Zn uptake system ZnuABC Zn-binding protein ZnuA